MGAAPHHVEICAVGMCLDRTRAGESEEKRRGSITNTTIGKPTQQCRGEERSLYSRPNIHLGAAAVPRR